MRTLIIAFLFVFAMDTLGQAIPRFLFRPIVRPFDYRPVRGPHKYAVDPTTGNHLKNGSQNQLTGRKGFDVNHTWVVWVDPFSTPPNLPVPAGTPGAVRVNWYSMPGVNGNTGQKYTDANQTFGLFENRRITRWSTQTPGGTRLINPQTNPNLRLYGVVNSNIQFYGAPQRQMIDDQNRSDSYLIPPAVLNNPGATIVRPQHLGYTVTDYGENDGSPPAPGGSWPNKNWQDPVGQVGQPNGSRAATQFSTQRGIVGQWSRCYYWYDFNVQSSGRAGLEGLKDFSLAGLPYNVLLPPTGTNSVSLAGIQTRAPNINNPVSVQMGWMIRVTRTSVAVAPATTPPSFQWVVPYTYTRVQIGTDGINDSSSSLNGYNRNSLFNSSSFFGNFVVTSGVFVGNQNNQGNAGTFGNNPTANIVSTRSMSTMLQYGSLTTKLRLMMRMPQLGPEFLFLNLQNPTTSGRANIMQ